MAKPLCSSPWVHVCRDVTWERVYGKSIIFCFRLSQFKKQFETRTWTEMIAGFNVSWKQIKWTICMFRLWRYICTMFRLVSHLVTFNNQWRCIGMIKMLQLQFTDWAKYSLICWHACVLSTPTHIAQQCHISALLIHLHIFCHAPSHEPYRRQSFPFLAEIQWNFIAVTSPTCTPYPVSRNTPWWLHQIKNIFCVTGPLCGEFTGHRTKASYKELWSAPE